MIFHYVDRIHEFEPRKLIRGIKNVTRNETLFYWLPSGERVLSPAVITESIAQLGAYLLIAGTDFEKRPVLLADEKTEYFGTVHAGDQIDMSVEVIDFDDDVIVTKGSASVRGNLVAKSDCSRAYMLPLEEFEPPEGVKRNFDRLYKPEFKDVSRVGEEAVRLKAVAGSRTYDMLRFIDGLIEHVPYKKVVGFKNFASSEPYFQTHFPRKPCVPGVLLLTFVGEVCQYLVKDDMEAPIRSRALVPTFIQKVRFRKFVEPGDQCILKAELMSGDPTKHDSEILVKAIIMANDKRVMQAEMGFRTMFSQDMIKDKTTGEQRKFSL